MVIVTICRGQHAPWREADPADRMICYEPDRETAQAVVEAARADRAAGATNISALTVAWTLGGVRVASARNWSVAQDFQVIGDADALEAHAEGVQQSITEGHRTRITSELTGRLHALEWTRLQLLIARRLPRSPLITSVPGVLDGVPAIVVGAGPSLNRGAKMLRRAQGHAAIIAVNSAVGPLEAMGVQPDVIVCVESHSLSVRPVTRSPLWREAIVVPGVHAHLEAWDAPSRAVLPALQPMGSIGKCLCRALGTPVLDIGGSVATFALEVAAYLGASPLVLIGCDSAIGGGVYAKGIAHAPPSALPDESKVIEVPAHGGGVVRTTELLDTYRVWLGDRCEILSARHEVINASVGGGHIRGTRELQPHQVQVRRWPRADPRRLILDAAQQAPRPDPLAMAAAIEAARVESDQYAEATSGIPAAAEQLRSLLERQIAEPCGQESLLAVAAAGSLDDDARLPALEQLEAAARSYGRVAQTACWLGPALDELARDLRSMAEVEEVAA